MKIINRLIVITASLCLFICSAHAEDSKNSVSDTWVEAKLVTMYTLNSSLSIFDIDVDVEDQVVYLTGKVESAVEKELAKELAESVEGVKSIKNEIIVVEKSEKEGARSNAFFNTVRDLTTTAKIKSELLTNTAISGMEIGVSTAGSVVTLTGTVPNKKHAALAEQIAKNADGVSAVENKLEVKG